VLPTSAMVKYIILQKSVQWKPSCSVWTNGWTHRSTDIMKLIIAFCNSVNMPKKWMHLCQYVFIFFKLSHRYEGNAKLVTFLRLPEPWSWICACTQSLVHATYHLFAAILYKQKSAHYLLSSHNIQVSLSQTNNDMLKYITNCLGSKT
jgi:hypothetical protein